MISICTKYISPYLLCHQYEMISFISCILIGNTNNFSFLIHSYRNQLLFICKFVLYNCYFIDFSARILQNIISKYYFRANCSRGLIFLIILIFIYHENHFISYFLFSINSNHRFSIIHNTTAQ